jgi:hypothetical protein
VSKSSHVKAAAHGGPAAGSGPPGTWALLEQGTTTLANGGVETAVSAAYPGSTIIAAFVSQTGSTSIYVHNDNTNQNPGTSDVHWALKGQGDGTVRLYLHAGSSGGGIIRWALYSLVP